MTSVPCRPRFIVLVALLLAGGPALRVDAQTGDGPSLKLLPSTKCLNLAVPVPDPITKTDFPFAIRITYEIDQSGEQESQGIVYMPATTPAFVPAGGRFPVVILLHATAYGYDWYEDLQRHLARNGFVVASINWKSNLNPLNPMLDHLDWLFDQFQYKGRLKNDIALLGHSKGGKHVVQEGANVAFQGWNVNAILALAPAPLGGPDVLVPYPSESLLVMLCEDDGDPFANGFNRNPGPPFTNVKLSGFFTYDAAGAGGNEFSSAFAPGAPFEKTMVYLRDGEHWAFSGFKAFSGDPVPPMYIDMTKGYLNAYLRWAIRGQTPYSIYFREKGRPASLSNQISLSTQYSSRERRVIENFEDTIPFVNTAGGQNVLQNVTVQHGNSVDLNVDSPHATKVYEVSWRQPGSLEFEIPGFPQAVLGNLRDVTSTKYLAFRVGRIGDDPLNPAFMEQDFHVRLRSGGGLTSRVRVSAFGRIPNFDGSLHQAMNTVVIPLCKFAGLDPTDVRGVRFEFTVPGHATGKIQVDNIEFVD